MQIVKNSVVTIHYEMYDADNTLNDKGDSLYHIGTACLHRGEVLVLHNSYETGGVRMDKLQDLLRWGMKLEEALS